MFEPLGVKIKVISSSWPEFSADIKAKKGQLWAALAEVAGREFPAAFL